MYESLKKREKKISVTGLGYVGLPVALEFSNNYSVIGFDINSGKIDELKVGKDSTGEMPSSNFENKTICFTSDPRDLKNAHFHIVAVPTPVTAEKEPDLRALEQATKLVGQALHRGDFVVYESTVYPGCTEEVCLPILESESGLSLANGDFNLGYSPERINPGDQVHTLTNIVKIVSGNDEKALVQIAEIYGSIIDAGIHKAPSIKVAEAAKIIENTQRDLNIALMNELSIIFDKMDIDTRSVLDAAGTKWNFLKFYPGLVGGHCIGVDPYYLTHKSEEIGYSPKIILSGRKINDQMPEYIANKLIQFLVKVNKNPKNSRVLICGITFKENVNDLRNSKAAELAIMLEESGLEVDILDPHINENELLEHYKLHSVTNPTGKYDAIILSVAHDKFKKLSPKFFTSIMTDNPILFDLKGIISSKLDPEINFWRL